MEGHSLKGREGVKAMRDQTNDTEEKGSLNPLKRELSGRFFEAKNKKALMFLFFFNLL